MVTFCGMAYVPDAKLMIGVAAAVPDLAVLTVELHATVTPRTPSISRTVNSRLFKGPFGSLEEAVRCCR